MKKKKVRKRLEKAIKAKQMCKIRLEYDPEEECRFLPLEMSDNLVYMIKDGDPVAHGYSLRFIDGIEKVKIEDSTMDNTSKDSTNGGSGAPKLNIADWPSAFQSLGQLGEIVVVESEKYTKKDGNYVIGKIEKVGKKQVGIRYYGPDKDWKDKKWKIPYEDITRVSTASRYTQVLTEYAPDGEAEVVEDFPDPE